MKIRYKFSHQAGGRYYWYSVQRFGSCAEQITCPVGWFWGME